MPIELTQEVVNRYAKWKAYVNVLNKKLTKTATSIKEAMQAGQVCPANGPAILVLTPVAGSPGGIPIVDWKKEFENYLLKVHKGDVPKVNRFLAGIAAKAPKTQATDPSVRLDKKINSAYDAAKAAEEAWEREADAA